MRQEISLTGPAAPHSTVPAPPTEAALEVRTHLHGSRMWWLGVHGGSGESTLAELMEGSRAAGHAWPDLAGESPPVVLVARTSVYGLERARIAATQWASSSTPPVRLLGLVMVADAPGRLPAPLHDLAKLTRGAVPRTWRVPWIEGLRLGVEPSEAHHPRGLRRLLSDVSRLTEPPSCEGAFHDPRLVAGH